MDVRNTVWAALGAAWVASCSAAAPAPATTPRADEGPQAELRVVVQGVRSKQGTVRCALFNASDGFPKDRSKAVRRQTRPIDEGGTAEINLPGLAPGTYAAVVFHDENGNGKLDTNFFGMPVEGLGASNNPPPRRGPPRFDEARFTLPAAGTTLTVQVNYF